MVDKPHNGNVFKIQPSVVQQILVVGDELSFSSNCWVGVALGILSWLKLFIRTNSLSISGVRMVWFSLYSRPISEGLGGVVAAVPPDQRKPALYTLGESSGEAEESDTGPRWEVCSIVLS